MERKTDTPDTEEHLSILQEPGSVLIGYGSSENWISLKYFDKY
jgi:hypothetical protein